jgi:uncharacterized YigZ family protein
MDIPGKTQTAELIRKNSTFIAAAIPIKSEPEVKRVIEGKRKAHPKAAHVVWAYMIGEGAHATQGFSDDGEPKGTAGKPLMEIIRYNDITNILITVVRYFGGIKLGAGGLVRAYSESASMAIRDIPRHTLVAMQTVCFTVEYHFYEPVKQALLSRSVSIENEDFTEQAVLLCSVPEDLVEEVEREIVNLTSGRALVEKR